MRRLLAACTAVATVCVGLVSSRSARAEPIAVVVASPESEEAARYFARQLDAPVARRESRHARRLDALILEARDTWHDDLVVVVDAERRVVSVVRPGDGTIGSRALAPSAAGAPYAVALAAVELLEIVRAAPQARAASLSPPTRVAPQPSYVHRLNFELGVVQSISANGDIGLLQPSLGAEFGWSRRQSPLWLGVGLHATGLAPMERDQVLLLPAGPDDQGKLRYARNELSLRLAAGHQQGPAAAFGSADFGLAFVDVESRDRAERLVAKDAHTAFWLGLSGDLRYSIGEGFALGIGAGASWFPVTTRFYASPAGGESRLVAFGEGAVEFRARFAVHWGVGL